MPAKPKVPKSPSNKKGKIKFEEKKEENKTQQQPQSKEELQQWISDWVSMQDFANKKEFF